MGAIAAAPTGANVETFLVLPAATVRTFAATVATNIGALSVLDYPNSHFLGYDLERLGGVMFSGINTRSTPPFLNLNLTAALSVTVTCNAWGYSDVILAVDIGSKSVQAFI